MHRRVLVPDLVRLRDGLDGSRSRLLVARVHVGEHLAGLDRLTALRAADDADRVVDRVLLRAPAATELQARDPDRDVRRGA